MKQIAALFVRRDSIYKTFEEVDCYDINRDARTFPGGMPVICHPPCRTWGRLAHRSKATKAEHLLAFLAVRFVRSHGGVLEHPQASRLWQAVKFPAYKKCQLVFSIEMCGMGFPLRSINATGGTEQGKKPGCMFVSLQKMILKV